MKAKERAVNQGESWSLSENSQTDIVGLSTGG